MDYSLNDFYVTLSSNVVNIGFENTCANFITQLPAPLSLDSNWRVGLSEIYFTNSWCNLRKDNEFFITEVHGNKKRNIYNRVCHVPQGRYNDVEELIDEITSCIKSSCTNNVKQEPKVGYNSITRRIHVSEGWSVTGEHLVVKFDDELAQMLGVAEGYNSDDAHEIVTKDGEKFGVDPETSSTNVYHAKRSYDMSGGIHSVFVYADIVDYSIVGDTRAQLLRLAHIPTDSKFGSTIIDRYENPHYLPLSTKEITSIEIHLKDDTDLPIPFEFGRTKLVLHFVKHG